MEIIIPKYYFFTALHLPVRSDAWGWFSVNPRKSVVNHVCNILKIVYLLNDQLAVYARTCRDEHSCTPVVYTITRCYFISGNKIITRARKTFSTDVTVHIMRSAFTSRQYLLSQLQSLYHIKNVTFYKKVYIHAVRCYSTITPSAFNKYKAKTTGFFYRAPLESWARRMCNKSNGLIRTLRSPFPQFISFIISLFISSITRQ